MARSAESGRSSAGGAPPWSSTIAEAESSPSTTAFDAPLRAAGPPHSGLHRPFGACASPVRPLSGGPSACRFKEDMPCEHFRSCSPLSFDRRLRPAVFPLRSADGLDGTPGYPPYNIERTGDNAYRITVAVAGFSEPELNIEVKENTLTIRGEKQAKTENRPRRPLPGHRGARVRARVPARRLRPGQGRVAGERSPARRPRPRDPRGQEAAPDPDRQGQRQAAWSRRKSRPDQPSLSLPGSHTASRVYPTCGA